MPTILPVTNLRNYSKVLCEVEQGNPVFLTKNGHGYYVLQDILDYKHHNALWKLIAALSEGELSARQAEPLPLHLVPSMQSIVALKSAYMTQRAHMDLLSIHAASTHASIAQALRAATLVEGHGLPLSSVLGFPSDALYLHAACCFPLYRPHGNGLLLLRVLTGKQPALHMPGEHLQDDPANP